MQELSVGISSLARRFDGMLHKTAIAAVAGAGLLLSASQTHAVVLYSGPVNLSIPATTNGLYLNVVTGANNLPGSTGGATVAGWDINLWSTTGLGFFNPTAPAGGAYVVSSGTTVANQGVGTLIDATNTYSSGTSTVFTQWNLNSSNNLFGFRFLNEADGSVHYGWARFSLGATISSPRFLVDYAYEDVAGRGLRVGAVPEPTTYAMMGVGLASLLLARRRPEKA